ncbi:type II toxin-antitoxin system HigB family toxin [Pseudomonas umsongensis]|nr:type II toxin-antitoxin system HigB family toxin [Pseudomonas umsongensis]MCK8688138.1 type II toxin-antitoxin system HigB family toxin [Pseudomonas umsongensis]SDT63144.1 HigB_toxin, RelE-like toxic component of a toxin-antitoxin system [Pseudomonas umsongensis]
MTAYRTKSNLFPNWEQKYVIMRLLGRDKLLPLKGKSEQIDKWISSWVSEIANANWKSPDELIEQYPNAQKVKEGHFSFCVCSSRYFIELTIAFAQGIAIITAPIKKL